MSESLRCVIFTLACGGEDEGGDGGGSGGDSGGGVVVAVCRSLYCYFYRCSVCSPLVVKSVKTTYSRCISDSHIFNAKKYKKKYKRMLIASLLHSK